VRAFYKISKNCLNFARLRYPKDKGQPTFCPLTFGWTLFFEESLQQLLICVTS
jgi:hypothetical protein